jgi:ketosteroid isomerase-like protein
MDDHCMSIHQTRLSRWSSVAVISILLGMVITVPTAYAAKDDLDALAELDTAFQAAVKVNDADTMASILHPDMVLILGDGRVNTREEQLSEARAATTTYEHQEEDPGTQQVRVWGDTAVVTAKLWVRGHTAKGAFDRRLWFSDVYVRTAGGWKYFFGQASIHLPDGR